MKTIKKNKKIQRASDKDAEQRVKAEGWKYCPKSEWKKGRDAAPKRATVRIRPPKKKATKKKKESK